ncbi:MAG: hypothetical protein HC828_06600 [Blastochloris sp.]|nr:hypothetical protein [Blastochloris sp.]
MPIRLPFSRPKRRVTSRTLEPQERPVPEPAPPDAAAASDSPRAMRPTRTRREIDEDEPIPPPTAIRGWYRRIGTSIALIGAALIGGLMWYYGGVFTLDFLGDTITWLGAFMRTAPWWQFWWIPLVVSTIEIFLWPRRERRMLIWSLRLGLWLAVLAFDVYTTMRGVETLIAGQLTPLIDNTDVARWVVIGVSGVVGLVFAYVPEKIARWVLSDLWNLWIAPLLRWIRRRSTSETQPAA